MKSSRYLNKAEEKCIDVFQKEFKGLLSLSFPQIAFLDPIDKEYSSGQYYITVGNGWKIHLNFGKLPQDLDDFTREVSVILRHEIEHYRTCPFDLLTHLRMVKTAFKITKNVQLSSIIANKVADIIIDTKNFIKYPEDTFWSERNWIKNSLKDSFSTLPRSSKLMFLVKQILWDRQLFFEIDSEILKIAYEISNIFNEDEIDDRKSFNKRVKAFSRHMVDLLEEENNMPELRVRGFRSAEGNGRELIVGTGEDVDQAVLDFASDTSLDNFENVLEAVGFNYSDKEKRKIWYQQQSPPPLEIKIEIPDKSESDMSYPTTWRLGDGIENLDIILSLHTSPKILPNITTKKWMKNIADNKGDIKSNPDVFFIIDSSGSMKWNPGNKESPYHIAVLSVFALLAHVEKIGVEVAGINFSNKYIYQDWTKDYNRIKDLVMTHLGGGTDFPILIVRSLISDSLSKKAIIVLTDDELSNWEECQEFFINLLMEGHKILVFLIRKEQPDFERYDHYINAGGRIYAMNSARDVYGAVLDDL